MVGPCTEGRNSVEGGKAVAWAPGSCRTAKRDGPRLTRLRSLFDTRRGWCPSAPAWKEENGGD